MGSARWMPHRRPFPRPPWNYRPGWRPRLPAPLPRLTFLIFAGKGGVGKTTLACATAVRLAREFPGKEILLFSTDPAHSLAACLEAPLGPQPVRLGPGLTAMEIDAPGEFAALKKTIPARAGEVPANRVREFRCPL